MFDYKNILQLLLEIVRCSLLRRKEMNELRNNSSDEDASISMSAIGLTIPFPIVCVVLARILFRNEDSK